MLLYKNERVGDLQSQLLPILKNIIIPFFSPITTKMHTTLIPRFRLSRRESREK